jgi:hypothetical protein
MAARRVGAVGVHKELSFQPGVERKDGCDETGSTLFVEEANEIVVIAVYTYCSGKEFSS